MHSTMNAHQVTRSTDIKLLELSDEAVGYEAMYDSGTSPDGQPLVDNVLLAVSKLQSALHEMIATTPATTLEGIVAKATRLAWYYPQGLADIADDDEGNRSRLTMSLIRDLLALPSS
jgi:hypothetical protein